MPLHPAPLVLRPHPMRQAPSCLARHRAFVSRFAVDGAVRSRVRPLSPVLLRRRGVIAGAGSHGYAPSWTWVVSPRFVTQPPPARGATRTSSFLLRESTTLRPVPVATPASRMLMQLRSHTRVERSSVRHERQAGSASVRVLRLARIERHAAYPRVSVVLSRPPAPVAAPGTERTLHAVPPPARSAFSGFVPPAPSSVREPLPPHELARVTDHVLAQLDRKVLSYRERHGQV